MIVSIETESFQNIAQRQWLYEASFVKRLGSAIKYVHHKCTCLSSICQIRSPCIDDEDEVDEDENGEDYQHVWVGGQSLRELR